MPEESMPQYEKHGLNPDFDLGAQLAQDKPTPKELKNFDNIAVQAARRLNESIMLDPKTGLERHEVFEQKLSSAIEELHPEDQLIVYFADLDGFKRVNDELGHSAGDELLGLVADAIRQTFQRKSDVAAHGSREADNSQSLARPGGDEFEMYGRKTAADMATNQRSADPTQEAQRQSEQTNANLKILITDTKFDGKGVKLSIGSALYEPGDTALTVLARADFNMLQNKYRGKTDAITPEDRKKLRVIVPYIESLGSRVESWLKEATFTA